MRAIYSSKERLGKLDTIRYEDLVKPEFKGKICTRSGKHEYNVALVSSMIAHHGMADTKTWLEGSRPTWRASPRATTVIRSRRSRTASVMSP